MKHIILFNNLFIWLKDFLNIFVFQDPILAQSKAKECLEILQLASDDRDLENRLVRSLGYEQFDFVKVLRKYRFMILYCILLAQAQTSQERNQLETKMLGDPVLAKILHELRETENTLDLVSEERHRKNVQRVSRVHVRLISSLTIFNNYCYEKNFFLHILKDYS